ncbi:MAG TPA: sulfite oxidase [Chloroflexota bacterium]|nr:sulfite oxidase [Chloroflexota bacterium]
MSESVAGPPAAPDLVVLATKPYVAETPLARQTEALTPNARFFIRNHFEIPALDTTTWKLDIGGAVKRARALTLGDVRALPSRTFGATVECAGNGRSFLPPPTEGNPFGYGAVSAATWTGASLRDVLGPEPFTSATREVLFVGADRGFEKNVGAEISFERSLPVEIALHPDTLLVYEMNGEPLPVEHGAPLRLLVPGWYGVASVKWLTEIRALEQPFGGYFQKQRYVIPNEGAEPTPLGERGVRALMIEPGEGAAVPIGAVEVRGLAWSGNQPVERVELSVDGGQTWRSVDLESGSSRYSWQRWHATWTASRPGTHTLKVRATDVKGRTQPDAARWNLLGYANNGVQSVTVEVRPR